MRMCHPSWGHARYAACRHVDSLTTLSGMSQVALVVSAALAGHVSHTAARISLRLHRITIAIAGVASVRVGSRWMAVGGG
jgi:hypothetical protein